MIPLGHQLAGKSQLVGDSNSNYATRENKLSFAAKSQITTSNFFGAFEGESWKLELIVKPVFMALLPIFKLMRARAITLAGSIRQNDAELVT